jgi:hypothetical protein
MPGGNPPGVKPGFAAWATGTAQYVPSAALSAARDGLQQLYEGLKEKPRQVAAFVAHVAHQAVCVGLPVFARQLVTEKLAKAVEANPAARWGLQAGTGAMMGLHEVLRHAREYRDLPNAVKGFHGMSDANWSSLVGDPYKPHLQSDQQKAAYAKLRGEQQVHSYLMTLYQGAAVVSNMAVAEALENQGDHAGAAKIAAKSLAISMAAVMRDGAQATFDLTQVTVDQIQNNYPPLSASAGRYGLAGGVADLAAQVGIDKLDKHARETALNALPPGTSLDSDAYAQALAAKGHPLANAAIVAASATLQEAVDNFQLAALEAKMGLNGKQQAAFSIKNPLKADLGRVLDQSSVRSAAGHLNNAVGNAVGLAQIPYVNIMASAMTQATFYPSLVRSFFAAAKVRQTHFEAANTAKVLAPLLERVQPRSTSAQTEAQPAGELPQARERRVALGEVGGQLQNENLPNVGEGGGLQRAASAPT